MVIVGQVITTLKLTEPTQLLASVALMPKLKAPAAVGVPLKTRVAALNVKPVGNVPVTLHVIVPLPPVFEKVVVG